MAWKFVRQPNGKLARWSDVVDNFTHMGLSEDDALLCARDEGCTPEQASRKVLAAVEDHKPWCPGVKGSGTDRWDDCLSTIEMVHGKEKRALREGQGK